MYRFTEFGIPVVSMNTARSKSVYRKNVLYLTIQQAVFVIVVNKYPKSPQERMQFESRDIRRFPLRKRVEYSNLGWIRLNKLFKRCVWNGRKYTNVYTDSYRGP